MIRWIDWCLDCDKVADSTYCDYHNTTRAVVIIDNE